MTLKGMLEIFFFILVTQNNVLCKNFLILVEKNGMMQCIDLLWQQTVFESENYVAQKYHIPVLFENIILLNYLRIYI